MCATCALHTTFPTGLLRWVCRMILRGEPSQASTCAGLPHFDQDTLAQRNYAPSTLAMSSKVARFLQ